MSRVLEVLVILVWMFIKANIFPQVEAKSNDGPITTLMFVVRTIHSVRGIRCDIGILYSMARIRRQRVDRAQEDQLANIGSDPLRLRMYDGLPYNLFTTIS
jgi:hypothetical protein